MPFALGGERPGADGLDIEGAAGLALLARAVGRGVVREDTTAGDPLLAHCMGQEADRGGLLPVGQHLHVRQAYGVIHRAVDLLVVHAPGTAVTTIASDPEADPLEPGQLFGVGLDHVARLLPLVPLHRNLGLQVPQTA